jgi:hypothetical protein
VRLDWNARARDLSQVVNLATPTPLPTACERQDPNGDILQPTTTGLAYRRAMTGTVAFTDGASHWSLGLDDSLLSWPGDAADPPPVK